MLKDRRSHLTLFAGQWFVLFLCGPSEEIPDRLGNGAEIQAVLDIHPNAGVRENPVIVKNACGNHLPAIWRVIGQTLAIGQHT
jgi:hypothetical protein